jgi:iron complex transport system ATP-binding protein
LNLASRFADRLLLLADGEVMARGIPAKVLTSDILTRAFRWPVDVHDLGPLGIQAVPCTGGAGSEEAG